MFSENSSQAGWGTLYFAMKAVSDFSPFHFVTHHQRSRRATSHTPLRPAFTHFSPSYKVGSWTTTIQSLPLSTTPSATPSHWYLPSRATWALFKLHKLPLYGQLDIPQILQSAIQINLTPFLSNVAHTISYNILMTNHWLVSAILDNQLFWYCILIQIVDFLNGFNNASKRAQVLDQKILHDAVSISDLLGDLVSLAVPQVYGSTQLTIGTNANGEYNSSDVMMFMKNVGGKIPKWANPSSFSIIHNSTEFGVVEPGKCCWDVVCCFSCVDVYRSDPWSPSSWALISAPSWQW